MAQESFTVGVVVVRRTLKGPWATHAWAPAAVLPAAPAAAPWTPLAQDQDTETFYAGSYEVTLYPGETAHYRDNLVSGRPSLWVALRVSDQDDREVVLVTADPYEGEAMAEAMELVVEAVPMPEEIQARLHAYYEAHHVEREFHKRKRKRIEEEVRRAPRVLGREDDT